QDITTILQIILQQAGYLVSVACSVPDAEAEYPVLQPDLMLLDILITDQKHNSLADGRDLCRRIRDNGGTARIIMMSSYAETEETVAAFGADDFIAKPFALDVLLQKIEHHLEAAAPALEEEG
ncbi:MAG TPA: response regulator, partial [Chitinophagaceae bacterium]|nr:response regulator [Chitinophagaceae bacterium]